MGDWRTAWTTPRGRRERAMAIVVAAAVQLSGYTSPPRRGVWSGKLVSRFRAIPLALAEGRLKRSFQRFPSVQSQRNQTQQEAATRLIGRDRRRPFRNHLIPEYEIPKYDGDLAAPNTFVPLQEETSRRKVDLLMRHFRTQTNRHWFSENLFGGLMRIRGMECACPSGLRKRFTAGSLFLVRHFNGRERRWVGRVHGAGGVSE